MSFPSDPVVKNSPASAEETWVQPLSWEDTLEKEMAPTPVFLPEESHGQRILAYSPQVHKQSDTAEATEHVCTNILGVQIQNSFYC